MKTIKGPAIFLAQFMGDDVPFDNLANLAGWAAELGYKAIQLPCDRRLFDLDIAADSQAYCDDVRGLLASHGLQVTELASHMQGQLVAVHPAYDTLFDGFAAPHVRGNPQARAAWATDQLKRAACQTISTKPAQAASDKGSAKIRNSIFARESGVKSFWATHQPAAARANISALGV